MRTIFRLAASAAALALAAPSSAQPLPDAVPAEVFAALPSIQGAKLSPDGRRLAAKVDANGKQVLIVRSLFDGKVHAFNPGKVDVNWWNWVNDQWLIVGVGDQVALYGEEVYVTRLIAVRADGSELKPIDWKNSGLYADDVIWAAKDGTPRILLSKTTGIDNPSDWYPSVFEVDLETGKLKKVVSGRPDVVEWDADGAGNIRLGYVDRDGKRSLLYRRDNASKWESIPARENLPIPSIFRKDGSAVGFSDASGYDAVHELDLPSFKVGAKLLGADGYDIDYVFANPAGDDVEGFGVTDRFYREVWVTPALKEVQAALDKAVGKRRATIVSWNRDRTTLLIEVGGPDQAGALYYWDTTRSATMQRVAFNSSKLQARALSPVRTIRYKARDGLEIEAVLTLPRGREGKNLPLIVMPHGGPAVRDSETWDWWSQFLAEQGYAVLQPNYRGSSGYGVDFLKKGEGEWGLKMQDDLIDAVGWAAKEGIADPKRVCIVGASYGGYAAMRGAQRDGAHYRCAVSYAGVSDLTSMMRYDRNYLFGKEAKTYWKKQARDFTAVSPRNFPGQFSIPILIAHGAEDKRVPVRQSRMLVDALKKAGKPYEYLEQKEGDHHFSRAEDRLEFLNALKSFLDQHNPA